MAARKQIQSWYSATTATMTKKRKCISMTPPERCTSTAVHESKPSEAATLRCRRPSAEVVARRAKTGPMADSRTMCSSE